jgi:hypothetical protein
VCEFCVNDAVAPPVVAAVLTGEQRE